MIPRTPSNNAKMAKAMNWSFEDASRFVVEIAAKSDKSGFWLYIHQDMWGHKQLKPSRLGDKWIIGTGPIDFDIG